MAFDGEALREDSAPLVPAGVLAQAWQGGPQANLSRLLQGCEVVPLDERLARSAGTLCGRADTADVIDAAVVVIAEAMVAAVVTGDADDLRSLAEAAHVDLVVHEI